MAVSSNCFMSSIDQLIQGNASWKSGRGLKMALLTSSASPNLSTWVHYSDLTNEVSGTGYTTGGVALASITNTETTAASWGTAWAATTTHVVGDIIRPVTAPSPDMLFICVSTSGTGTTGASEPTWTGLIPGQTVTDNAGANQVVWSCLGESITVYSSANAQWTSSTFSAAYGVIYDPTSGTGTTEPLIALVNFGGTLSPSSGTLTVSPSTNGWFFTSPS